MTQPEFSNTQAHKEGWGIFHTPGFKDGDWQLQKLDEANVFEDDAAAWEFVYGKFRERSPYHRMALQWLRIANPAEFLKLVIHCISKRKENRRGLRRPSDAPGVATLPPQGRHCAQPRLPLSARCQGLR